MKKPLILLSLVLCFSADAQHAKKKEPFIGLNKAAVIEQFGTPTTTSRNEKGEVWVYLRERTLAGGGAEPASSEKLSAVPTIAVEMPNGSVIAGKKTEAYKFFLNKKGEVYSWKIEER